MLLFQPSFSQLSTALIYWSTLAVVLYLATNAIYNLCFHSLRAFPGPLAYRASRLPYIIKSLRGTLPFYMLDLHERYGSVVRVAPNELAFSDPSAWSDIMGHQPRGAEVGKWIPFYKPIDSMPTDIISADRDQHSLLRRQLAHGFSDKSMREQGPLIKKHIDLLIQRLRENCTTGKPLDMTAWYNFTTFDVIGDLAFGSAFGCLENSSYHPWVKNILQTAWVGTILQAAAHYPTVKHMLFRVIPKSLIKEHEKHMMFAKNQLLKRIQYGHQRPDLIEGLLQKTKEWDMRQEDLESNASLLIIAGSETTATLLTGATYFLLTSPDTLAKLTTEVRSKFNTEDEININSVTQLPYMLACLDEALRCYPPVAIGLPRVVPKGGRKIAGHFVPEDTHVAIHQWATYHNSSNFTHPFSYRPERFSGDPEFARDKREALQPFHYGPRGCLGKNLAYAEMRLILARVVFNFDLKIAEESQRWIKQRIFNFWDKGPLLVYLTSRASS